MKKNKSFTVLETVVVVVVVTILGYITYSQYVSAQKKDRDTKRKADLDSVTKVLVSFYNDYKKFPSKYDKLNPIDINKFWGKEFVDRGYTYMKVVPQEDYLSKQYCYDSGENGNFVRLFADLENDPDCIKGVYSCEGENYCYTEVVYPDKIK